MPTFKITLEYDGSCYHGWQVQPGFPTIQAEVQAAIQQVIHAPISVTGAGRTDAGVHAVGQVACFSTAAALSAAEWQRTLNGLLPADIAVLAVEAVSEDFHARFNARSKLYEYRILTRPHRSALERNRAWHITYRLDIETMRRASKSLLGRHDFSSFQGSPTDTENAVCEISLLELTHDGDDLSIKIEGDRFLKQMVRNIVGTLVEVGRGKLKTEELEEILAACDRTKAGPTAPPQGLYLVRVNY